MPIRWLFRLGLGRPNLRQSVEWEIEHYLAEQTDRLVAEGMHPDDARAEAERRFGNMERQRRKIVAVDRRRVVMRKRGEIWDTTVAAFRQALRGLHRSPGLSIAVVLTLGLGIGANAAMFGVVDRILLRAPDQIAEPGMVRRVFRDGDFFGRPAVTSTSTYPDVADLRTVPEFASVGAATSQRSVTLGSGEQARQVRAVGVTHDLFTTLGVAPHLGRLFDGQDDQPESALTAVVSQEFWESSLGGDRDVLGTTLTLSGRPVTVVGVAPKGFTGIDLEPVDVWLPAIPWEYAETGSDRFMEQRGHWWLRPVVRIRDEATVPPAEAQATALHINGREEARRDPDVRILTAPLIEGLGPGASAESRVARWVVGVSLIVLLIACANVANLLLAQGAGRRREVAVRLSLGVSRGRLLRERVLETLFLAGLGGVAALALAHWGGGVIRGLLIPDILWTTPPLGGRVVAVTAALAVAGGLLAGFGPAVQSTRADLARELSRGGRGSARGRSKARGVLTVAQATLSVVLLVGAGLFIRSVMEVRSMDLGVDVDRLVQVSLEFEGEAPDAMELRQLYDDAMSAVERVPGVASVAGADMLFGWLSIELIRVPGLDSLPIASSRGPFVTEVTPGYMRTMGLTLSKGRPLQDTDVEGAPRVAVVNDYMATSLWPDRDPLGACFHYGDSEECTTVVGVVETASTGDLEGEPVAAYYLPVAQMGNAPNGLYVRTEGSPRELAADLAPLLRTYSPRVRFAQVQTFRELLGPETRSWTLGASLFTAFGLLALLVAAIGLYSVLAFDVADRTREIGIRSALGAQRAQVLRGVVATGVRLAVLGVALGLAVSAAVAPYAQDLLFRVDGRDPMVLVSVALILLVVAHLASLVPGMRATRVDPVVALRSD